ncbi:ATP-binding response regulator [Caballeronia ptereochthonis]|uniref:histidine kinase n=1 Tax=Caballeronia ptereochthonis TaxID=1777144 RepID=A0A158A0J4_9BURK|nr:hybrid sensor histidine kinase/response regulator [Caballeronia ptereochthonis]SAK51270.1 integral membrane sensor hybrid histidine kinase [Caballeronia ptereochthonis]
MHGDQQQSDIDNDLASALYAADPASFLTHGCAIALLSLVYLARPDAGRLPLVCVLFYGIANCLAIGLWAWRRYRPFLCDARRWIGLHALRNVVLHTAPGFSIWFAFQNESFDLAAAHTVLLIALAALAYVSNGLNLLNLWSAVPTLLAPATALHLMQPVYGRFELGVVLAIFIFAVHLFALQYRELFRRIVEARVDQQRLAETVSRQKGAIEEASLAKTRFFAAASHDLRQPLHAIGLLAHALTDRSASEAERDETAQHIICNVEALNHLFNQVLDLARIESGVTQVIPQHFLLAELLARIDRQFRPAAAAKGLALRIAPTVCVAFTDPVLLERVIANLVSNAVRYTERGSIWIGVRNGANRERCFIEVRDSGIGIAPYEHELVFEEFYQVPQPHLVARQGHGLGLSTVRRLTRLLGEELTLRSDLDRGTTIRVPVRTGDASLVTVSLAAPLPVSAFIEGRRVLCVDDDPANLDALGTLLTRWGCIVRGCRDELAAVRAISDGFVPDVLLCDYQIGRHQTGVEALQVVREALRRRGHNEPACVMITGDMASPELAALAGAGLPVLHKPVTPTRLRRTLEVMLQPRSQENEAA